MPSPLMETKLLPPRPRRESVPRPRLAELLRRAENAPVVVVAAPAGFGKTTLVASWLAGSGTPGAERSVAWVSLDDGDRQAASFWTYVLVAIDRAVPGSTGSALALLQSGQASFDTVIAGAVNELSVLSDEVTLVLDDYHLADGPDVAAGMGFLVDHLPPQLQLVLSTRADPALPLPRLRARGELVEIRAAELRFTGDEAAAYLNDLHGLALDSGQIAALEARTEGWVAALQLAALSLRGRTDASGFIDRFTGDDRFVVDYLVDEVLRRQPDDVRRFLLDTSILDRLSAPLCDAVLASTPGAAGGTGRALLDRLDRENLFLVSLDDQRRWYRYHHLFADVLHAQLLEERAGEVAELHRRASQWYAAAGETRDAVRHALAAGDAGPAADLVEAALPSLQRDRREDVIRRWIDELPVDLVAHRPVLAIGFIGALMAGNEFAGVPDRLRALEDLMARPAAEQVVVDHAQLASLPARIEMYHAALALVGGDPAGTVARAQRALELTPEGDHLTTSAAAALAGLALWAGGDVVTAHHRYVTAAEGLLRAGHVADVLGCSLTIADLELTLGRLGDAEQTLRQALELAERHGPPGPEVMRGTSDMLVALSRVAWHRNDLDAAADHLRRAEAAGEASGLPQNPYRWRVAMARLRIADRDWQTALELLDEAERVYVGDFSPPVHPIHATRARVLAAWGDLAAASAWARQHDVRDDDELSYLREYEHLVLARILLAEHRLTCSAETLTRSRALLDRLLAAAEAGERVGTVIEIEALRAQALQAAASPDAAVAALEHALALGEPDGWVRVFVDAGPPMADLLRRLPGPRQGAAYVRRLLDATEAVAGPGGVARRAPDGGLQSALVDPLSERELDVLRLLASELDGPAIARELVVSLNTVRTHTKRIYTKLGVNSRRAAVSRAHQLGLLSRSRRG